MRTLRKAIVLGFAALGIYKAWELIRANVDVARTRAARARDRIEPALQDATDTLKSASRDAVKEMADPPRASEADTVAASRM